MTTLNAICELRPAAWLRAVSLWLRTSFLWLCTGSLWLCQGESTAAERPVAAADSLSGSAAVEFFETQIRPILADNCFGCHGEETQENGLRLDSLQAMLDGGQFGRAVVPGKPSESLMLLAIRHEDTLRMPPESKLTTRQIVDLTHWVELGAAWPNATAVLRQRPENQAAAVTEEDRQFWAFQPLASGDPPAVEDHLWSATPVDQFLHAALSAAGLSPAPPADRRTWIRRATFDLHGLPPNPQEVTAFLADDSPAAYASAIDRLLASPRYGERWGRHWLDVARYADSNGLDENICYANAFRYRDYVIEALNADKPYDQFVREQIAGDLLPTTDNERQNRQQKIATGFLALGAKMLACDDPQKMRMDIVDEQLNTLSQAILGLTIGCARCHDHKFDPIPATDYYALAGIFHSTKTMENYKVVAKWYERLIATPQQREQQAKLEVAKSRLAASKKTAGEALLADARRRAGDYWQAAAERATQLAKLDLLRAGLQTANDDDRDDNDRDHDWLQAAVLVEAEDLTRGTAQPLDDGYGKEIGVIASKDTGDAEYDVEIPIGGYYGLALRYAAKEARPMTLLVNDKIHSDALGGDVTGGWYPQHQRWSVETLLRLRSGRQTLRFERHAGPIPHVDQFALVPLAPLAAPTDDRPVVTAAVPRQPELHPLFVNQLAKWLHQTDGKPPLSDAGSLFSGEQSLLKVPREPRRLYRAETVARLTQLEQEVEACEASLQPEMRAMGVTEGPEIGDMPLHHRGNYFTPGRIVRRGFLQVLQDGDSPLIDSSQSGRLQLANWITQPNTRASALAARVMVNRIWRWHFGQGIVPSTDNFGKLGEAPTNRALLDYLAKAFIRQNWSIKAMHRLIMNTAAYRMSTTFDPEAAAIDPENRLLWRMNRRRLEAEAVRDSLLALGGTLDDSMGGTVLKVKNHAYVTTSGTAISDEYDQPRRSIYLPVVRSAMYQAFTTFDFPDPALPSGDRAATTIAPQALFMTNSQLVHDQMGSMAARLLRQQELPDSERVGRLYEQVFSRPPTAGEIARALQFVGDYHQAAASLLGQDQVNQRLQAWRALCRVLVSTNEFIYVE